MATRVEANYVLTASDETARAFRSVEKNLKGMKEEMAGIGKTAGLAFKLFVGGELLEGLRKFGGAMFDVKNATNKVDADKITILNEQAKAAKAEFLGMAAAIGGAVAPAVSTLFNRFTEASGAFKYFQSAVEYGIFFMIRAVGIFADSWDTLKAVIHGMILPFQAYLHGLLLMFQQIDHAFVGLSNDIFKTNLKTSATLDGMVKASGDRLKQRVEDINTNMNTHFADSFIAEMNAIKKSGDAKAVELQKQADTRVRIKKEENARINEENQFQGEIVITQLRASDAEVAAEEQAIKERMHKDRLQELGQFAWMEQAKWNLQQKGFKARLAGVSTLLGQAANLMNSDRKKEFEIGKKAAIANALVEMGKGIGVAIGYGPILGPPMAALVLANGLANIRQIKSQQFAGGGSANVGATAVQSVDAAGLPDRSGSVQEAPTMPMSSQSGGPSRQVTLIVQSDSGMVSMDWVRNQLAPVMNEAAGDGVKFMVA